MPVVLADATSPPNGGPDLAGIVDRSPKGPPGKFYRGESALSLLDTLRTGGPSARLMPAPDVTEEQNAHFERFRLRLNDGDLVSPIFVSHLRRVGVKDSMLTRVVSLLRWLASKSSLSAPPMTF